MGVDYQIVIIVGELYISMSPKVAVIIKLVSGIINVTVLKYLFHKGVAFTLSLSYEIAILIIEGA